MVLVHGGRFDKDSWDEQARELAAAGFRALAIDLRGVGRSRGPGDKDMFSAPFHRDVLAAARYLKSLGVTTVSAVGGSLGGWAAGDAMVEAPGEIDRLVMIGSEGSGKPEHMRGRKLFIVSRDDLGSGDIPRLPKIREHFERATEPKELIVLDGSAHAQFIFPTAQGERLMREILRFLTAP